MTPEHLTPAQQKVLALLREEPRLRATDIVARSGVPLSTVWYWRRNFIALGLFAARRRTGWPRPPTAEQIARVTQIVILRDAGRTWADIGDALGISRQAAHHLARHHAPEVFE